ncbi:MAG: MBL fold metallo-hydrolase [Simkaniaceae bacterium]|nr:MBL fold metallo-hydrolase [Simkaniaceae bacterium]MCF7852178.1 MBL fold metallo-hydrolase [Simkaniaceae bacterium]
MSSIQSALFTSSTLSIYKVTGGPFETNTYIVSDHEKNTAIIDPTFDCSKTVCGIILNHALNVKALYITHSHFDHIAEAAFFKRKYHIPVWVHRLDAPNLIQPGSDRLPFAQDFEGVQPDDYFVDMSEQKLGSLEFIVLHTPGHSPGSVSLYFQNEGVLFSGDTLFKHGMGNLNLPTSEPAKMHESLIKLAQLPLEVRVYPGHGDPTTIGEESWLKKL